MGENRGSRSYDGAKWAMSRLTWRTRMSMLRSLEMVASSGNLEGRPTSVTTQNVRYRKRRVEGSMLLRACFILNLCLWVYGFYHSLQGRAKGEFNTQMGLVPVY